MNGIFIFFILAIFKKTFILKMEQAKIYRQKEKNILKERIYRTKERIYWTKERIYRMKNISKDRMNISKKERIYRKKERKYIKKECIERKNE